MFLNQKQLLQGHKKKTRVSGPVQKNVKPRDLRRVMLERDHVWEQNSICLKNNLDLCRVSGAGVVFPCSVKGWADRQTHKQAAFISVRETWQQRAHLPGRTPASHSSVPPTFYLSCHRLAALKRRHGEDGGALKSLLSFLFFFHLEPVLCLAHRLNAAADGGNPGRMVLSLCQKETDFFYLNKLD